MNPSSTSSTTDILCRTNSPAKWAHSARLIIESAILHDDSLGGTILSYRIPILLALNTHMPWSQTIPKMCLTNHVHMYVCMYVCMYACMYVCMYIYICNKYIYIYMYTYYLDVYIIDRYTPLYSHYCWLNAIIGCKYIYIYICVCICIYIYIFIYIYIYVVNFQAPPF